MDSLYGGKPGISFILKASYPTIADMIAAFKGGGNYTAVWYGEYVIIDTANKNDIDNGKIYRRGLDYQNSMGGAEYIGQVVGPSSGTPYFQIDDLNTTLGHAKDPVNNETSWKRYPTGKDKDGRYIISEDGDGTDIATFEFNRLNALVPGKDGTKYNDAIKYAWVNIRDDGEGTDSWFYVGFQIPYLVIDYAVHSVSPYNSSGNRVDLAEIARTDDKTHPFYESWNIGVPKGVKGDTLKNLKIIKPTASDKNNIYQITAINTSVDTATGNFTTTLGTPGYNGIDDDIAKGRQILVYEYSFYDKTSKGTTVLIYLGDYNMITGVDVSNDGTITVTMTHDDNTVIPKKIRWVDTLSLTNGDGSAGGKFTFNWNNDRGGLGQVQTIDISWIKGLEIEENGSVVYTYAGTPDRLPANASNSGLTAGRYRVRDFLTWIKSVSLDRNNGKFIIINNRNAEMLNVQLDWIKDIYIDEDGTIHFVHTDSSQGVNGDVTYTKAKIRWVSDVSLTAAGVFTMQFNDGTSYTNQLDWINDVYIDEASGEIAIHHVDNRENSGTAKNGSRAEILPARLKLITKGEILADGTFTLKTNTGETINIFDARTTGSSQNFKIKIIDNVTLSGDNEINGDKRIHVTYNTDTENPVPIGSPINYIQDMVVRTNDWHLLVLYNDPTHRKTANDLNAEGKDTDGHTWVNGVLGTNGQIVKGDPYWQDMGTIKDQAGILVGFNLTFEDIQRAGKTQILDYLNDDSLYDPQHPNWNFTGGLTGDQNLPGGQSTKGKVITYRPEGRDDVEFYAYDYNTGKWYYLGKIEDTGLRDARMVENTAASRAEALKGLTTNGVILLYSNNNISNNGLPAFWGKDAPKWS